MKRGILYCIILAVTFLLPVEKQDISTLEPIEAVWMGIDGENVVLKTDSGDVGRGVGVEEALADMKISSLGIVYLDTAQYLLVSQNALQQIPSIAVHLKKSVRVCIWDGNGEIFHASRYMKAHLIGCPLRKWKESTKLYVLTLESA